MTRIGNLLPVLSRSTHKAIECAHREKTIACHDSKTALRVKNVPDLLGSEVRVRAEISGVLSGLPVT